MLGGVVIGLLTILGDLLDAMGSSTGILLAVNNLYSYFEIIIKKMIRLQIKNTSKMPQCKQYPRRNNLTQWRSF